MEKPPRSEGSRDNERRTRPAASPGARRALARIRKLCLAFPETTERLSHAAPTFFVRDKTAFVMFHDNHHDDGRLAIWCAAPHGMQRDLLNSDPVRFFRPPYVGHRGWVGVRLDSEPDWSRIARFVEDAYRIVAPAKFSALLETQPKRRRVGADASTTKPAVAP